MLRRATAADIPALHGLVESAYRGEASAAGWTTEAHLLAGRRTRPEVIAGQIERDGSLMLVAEACLDEVVAPAHADPPHADPATADPATAAAQNAASANGDTATGPVPVIVGTCHVERFSDHAYFGMFAVSPAAQGRGIGRLLADEVERVAREEWGLAEVRMTVIAQREELIAWYERLGYRRTGVREPFPGADTSTPLVEDLHMVVLAKRLR